MKEDFLHYVWLYNYFDQTNLQTTTGQSIRIITNGTHNHDSGPDFSNAQINIDGIDWNGQVEIHIQSSDWLKHKHQFDINYESVILHVVWKEDKPIMNRKKVRIPCIELCDRVNPSLLDNYTNLILNKSWIACADSLHLIDKDRTMLWLNAIAIERMEQKAKLIHDEFEQLDLHWDHLFLVQLSKAFGLKVNQDAFASLAKSLKYEVIQKYAHQLKQLEALLFGQAGMLSESWKDPYAKQLTREYNFLQHKHSLQPIPLSFWKFGRLRPANFPTIRIAQLAQLLHRCPTLFSQVLEGSIDEVLHLFDDLVASDYWDTHYRFDTESKKKKKALGKSRIHLIFINCICPMLFSYGKYRQNQDYIDKAITLLETLPAESNAIVNQWASLSITPRHAIDSQALIHLKKTYCDQYKCVSCQIGHQLLTSRKK